MTANIGALTATLGIETAAFIRDMGKAAAAVTSSTAQINKSLKTVDKASRDVSKSLADLRAGALTLAGALAFRQFAQFGKSALDSASAVGDLSDRTGIATKQIQELQFAAEQGGVGADQMSKALEKLTLNVGKAREGTGDLAAISKKLGTDLSSPQAALADIADEIAKSDSASTRAQIAVAAFGKEGVKLIPVLMDGAKGLREQGDAAQKLGAVMSDDVVRAGKAAGDQLQALTTVFQKTFDIAIIKGFAGELTGASSDMERAAEIGRKFGEAVGSGLKVAATAARVVADNFQLIKTALMAFAALKAAELTLSLAGAMGKYVIAVRDAIAAQGILNASVKAFPAARLVTLIAAATAALYAYQDATVKVGEKSVTVGGAVSLVWTATGGVLARFVDYLVDVNQALGDLLTFDFEGMAASWKRAGDDLKVMFTNVGDAWNNIGAKSTDDKDFSALWKQYQEVVTTATAAAGDSTDTLGIKVGELTDKLKLENDALSRLHDAYGVGAHEVRDVTVANEVLAKLAALQIKVTDEQRAAVLALVDANQKLTASVDVDKTMQGLSNQTSQLQAMFVAAQKGALAVQDVNDAMEAQAALGGPGAVNTDADIARVSAQVKANNDLARSIKDVNAVRSAQHDLQIAQMQAGSAGAIGEDAQRAAQNAIDRQRELNALMDEYGTTSQGTAAKLLQLYDAQASAQEEAFVKTRDTQAAVEELSGFADQAFDRIGSAITTMFAEGGNAAVKFKDVAKAVLSELAQELFKLAALNPLKNLLFGQNNATLSGIGGLFGSLFGQGTGYTAPLDAESVASIGNIMHTGGTVGSPGTAGRMVNPSVFNGAPRLHDGLRSDEFPAILQKGETVIPRSGKGSGGDVYQVDMKGASVEAVQRLEKFVQQVNGSIEKRALSSVVSARQRNPRLFGGR